LHPLVQTILNIYSSIHYLTPQEFEELAQEKMTEQSLLKYIQDIDSNPVYTYEQKTVRIDEKKGLTKVIISEQ